MKRIALGIVSVAFALVGCSQMTVLRTEEMRNVGTDVQVAVLSNLDSAVHRLKADNKKLRKCVDSLKAEILAQQEASALLQKRMMAEITTLSRRVSDESERNDSRQEEIIYRLDMLLGKSDKILAKKVVVNGAAQAPISMDSVEREAERLVEAEAMFNTARSDYHRGEYKLAYSGFKQVYEQMKTGELGENSLYWMGLCLVDVNQVEKAKKVFEALTQSFPNGQKMCTSLFKLSAIYGAEGNVDMQKQYLQKILSGKTCANSGEFEQAAEILQDLLEGREVAPIPLTESKPAPETPAANEKPAAPADTAAKAPEAPAAPAAQAPAAGAKPAEKAETPATEKPAKKKSIPSAKKN